MKTPRTSNIPQNSPNQTLKLDNKLSKSRQQIYQENYQKNKEKKKAQQKERYHRKKELVQKTRSEQLSKYYEAEAIKVLMSFKEYTELNPEKKHLWQDFNWTLKDCREAFQKGFGNVVAVMKLAQVADNLIRDYWTTAKSELKSKSRSWNSLTEGQQQKLIRYWGYEKARVESGYIAEEEKLEKQSKEYLKAIELAKFHEERGKIKCPCYDCENKRVIQKEVKWNTLALQSKGRESKIDKGLKEQEADKGKCNECGKVRILDEENGLCHSCMSQYE